MFARQLTSENRARFLTSLLASELLRLPPSPTRGFQGKVRDLSRHIADLACRVSIERGHFSTENPNASHEEGHLGCSTSG